MNILSITSEKLLVYSGVMVTLLFILWILTWIYMKRIEKRVEKLEPPSFPQNFKGTSE